LKVWSHAPKSPPQGAVALWEGVFCENAVLEQNNRNADNNRLKWLIRELWNGIKSSFVAPGMNHCISAI
jgi:hypothetical protein